jgi:hypothetical protein
VWTDQLLRHTCPPRRTLPSMAAELRPKVWRHRQGIRVRVPGAPPEDPWPPGAAAWTSGGP